MVLVYDDVLQLDKEEHPLIGLYYTPRGLLLVIEVTTNTLDQKNQTNNVLCFPNLGESRGTFQSCHQAMWTKLEGINVHMLTPVEVQCFLSCLGLIVVHPHIFLDTGK